MVMVRKVVVTEEVVMMVGRLVISGGTKGEV